jgi:hypothetical protein
MAVKANVPLYMNEADFSIATDDYAAAISSVMLMPSHATVRFDGLKATASTVDVRTTWQVQFSYAQDWTTTGSLALYLQSNTGTQKTIVFKPKSGAGQSWTVTALIMAGQVGGQVGTHATASVTLEVIGQPTFSAGA